MTEHSAFQALAARYQDRVESALAHWLPAEDTHPRQLHAAMRYAVLGGGKRVRPILVYATGETLGLDLQRLDAIASAVEIIHAYSLIHDDLPAMDDDDLRRGKPTCHRAFDEATAILAGDALQALAFHILAHDPLMDVEATVRLRMIESLALACGSRGMAGGQAIDLASVGQRLDIAELEDMHIHKTGALIRASVLMAALMKPDMDAALLDRLDHYGKCVGLAFQIHDDVLDVEGETATLGKPQGSDAALDKPTYPTILGLAGARRRAQELHGEALKALEPLGTAAEPLRLVSGYIVERPN